MKDAASFKTGKTDGRTLLANSDNLRGVTDDGPAPATATATDADAAAAGGDGGDGGSADVGARARSKSHDDSTVVATGFAVVADYTDKLPANEFFTPGRLFAVRVKYSDFPG